MSKSFAEVYDAAVKDAAAVPLNITIHQWKEPGEVLIGRLEEVGTLPEGKYGSAVNRYILQTDAGLMSCLLGGAADKEVGPKLKAGDLLRIEFQGQKDIGDDRVVNLFDIQRFGHEGKVKGGEAKHKETDS